MTTTPETAEPARRGQAICRKQRRPAATAAAAAAAAAAAVVAALAISGCSWSVTPGDCQDRARGLDRQRPDIDDSYEALRQEWEQLESERSAVDIDAVDDSQEWERLTDEWEATEHRLSVFVELAEGEPESAIYPLGPRQHHDGWVVLFLRRADLNADWAEQSAKAAAHARGVAGGEQAADLYDRYAAAATRWADHWRRVSAWHQDAADSAWECLDSWPDPYSGTTR